MSAPATRRFGSVLLGVASMMASLGAIAFLITSDVAVAEERPEVQVQAQLEAKTEAQAKAESQVQAVAKPARKARPSPKRKRVDLGRFEGY